MSPESFCPHPENPNINRQTTIQIAKLIAFKKIKNGTTSQIHLAKDWIDNLFDDLCSREPIEQPEVVSFDLRPIDKSKFKHYSKVNEISPIALELAQKAVLEAIFDFKYPIPSELTLGVATYEGTKLYPVITEEGRTIVEIETLIPGVILKYFFTDTQDKTLIGGRELIIKPLNPSL